jgi:hypothetical protein
MGLSPKRIAMLIANDVFKGVSKLVSTLLNMLPSKES